MQIGILGYSGTIAHYTTEILLKKGFPIIGGQRHQNHDFDQFQNFKFMQTDVSDKQQLTAFCHACDVVVNCTSPSSVYGITVAQACAEAGKIFVDPTDLSEFQTEAYPDTGFLFSCGYMPGFSEYLVKYLAEQYFEQPESVILYQGGTDMCSPSAFADIILSADSAGKGDTRIVNGKRVPEAISISDTFSLPFFEYPVILKAYLSHDFIKVCEHYRLANALSMNIYPNFEVMNLYFRGMMASLECLEDKKQAMQEIIAEVGEDIRTMQKNPARENVLCAEMFGIVNGKQKYFQALVRTKNNSEISGWFLAESVQALLKGKAFTGRKYGFELADKTLWERAANVLQQNQHFSISEIETFSFS